MHWPGRAGVLRVSLGPLAGVQWGKNSWSHQKRIEMKLPTGTHQDRPPHSSGKKKKKSTRVISGCHMPIKYLPKQFIYTIAPESIVYFCVPIPERRKVSNVYWYISVAQGNFMCLHKSQWNHVLIWFICMHANYFVADDPLSDMQVLHF